MIFNYKVIDKSGKEVEGTIDAINKDVAISSLQRRGYIISSVKQAGEGESVFQKKITWFERVSSKDMVILSRQIATLFGAQVSALRIFRLLSSETKNPLLRRTLSEVADDIQGGNSISKSLEQHPKIFSAFYINMVKAGEESGKLDQIFEHLADYLDRTEAIVSKAKNALVYPAFVIATFIIVMILMLTLVIPKISTILIEAGQDIPIYTKFIIGLSNFLTTYGLFLLGLVAVGGVFLYRYLRTDKGKISLSQFRTNIPYIGNLYQKLYLTRIADNMNTMLVSGISMVRAIEITADVVDDQVYKGIMTDVADGVKGGESFSQALSRFEEIPGVMVQMSKIGEETGELGSILKTLANFYQREVNNAVDTLVSLIEPVMIVLLGLGVGFVLASVLIPIYNISSAI